MVSGLRRTPLRRIAPAPGAIVFELDGVSWNLDPESSQLGGVHDVFIGKEYDAVLGYVAAPDSTVVDAGANVGAYTLWQWRNMQGRGRIVAVEASPTTREVLETNILCNRADASVAIVPAAVWRSSGEVDFVMSERSSSTSGVRETLDASLVREAEGRRVAAVSLDDLLDHPDLRGRAVDVLKLDVEGAEEVVLRSVSPEVMARIRRVVVETDERTREGVREVLLDAGFTYEGIHRRVVFFSREPIAR